MTASRRPSGLQLAVRRAEQRIIARPAVPVTVATLLIALLCNGTVNALVRLL